MPIDLAARRCDRALQKKLEALINQEITVTVRASSTKNKGFHFVEEQEVWSNSSTHESTGKLTQVDAYGVMLDKPEGEDTKIILIDERERNYIEFPVPQRNYFPFRQSRDFTSIDRETQKGEDYNSIFEVVEIMSVTHQGKSVYP